MAVRLDGRRILLHAEQGLGDTIQFIRYLPLVAQRGGAVIVRCMPELGRLLQVSNPDARIDTTGDASIEFDVHCPLLSLPPHAGDDTGDDPRDSAVSAR